MSVHLKPGWLGLTCASVDRATHPAVHGEDHSVLGPLQITWSEGSAITFDVGADWKIQAIEGRWRDPFGEVSSQERNQLRNEVGLWELSPVDKDDALSSLLGNVAVGLRERLNANGDLSGIDVEFSSGLVLELSVWEGELTAMVRPQGVLS
ncbi:hypothetical protein [Austwickia chelonae]|uniref:hypothetical protein n=1 Tax=Austwickia chelonae TaxID=100225 RepID=UPI000E238B91|nr:hypothetical protein [Austwickia chelonae]